MTLPQTPHKQYSTIASAGPAANESSWWLYFKLTRLHKFPAGSIVLFWPCTWGLLLGATRVDVQPSTLSVQMVLYLIWSILEHNAGCVWNDMCDVEFDRQVERSKNRPIACGAVSITEASILLVVHMFLCMGVLLAFNNELVFYMGIFRLFFLTILYPFMKRWTHWPQAWLGVALNWGAPVAWVSTTGSFDWKIAPILLGGGICWTIHYDTIYACQDRKDDVHAGVKSTAVLFGDYVRPILAVFASLFLASLTVAGVLNGSGLYYFVIVTVGAALHLTWQLLTIDFANGAECWSMFKANGNSLGLLICVGMFLDLVRPTLF